MFVQAGGLKLFGWFGGMPGANGAPPPVLSQVWIGGVLEVVGGAPIVLGLFTRPVAFILSGEMAVAYWQFHAPHGTWPIQNHGEGAVLYCFIFSSWLRTAPATGAWTRSCGRSGCSIRGQGSQQCLQPAARRPGFRRSTSSAGR